MTIQHAAGVVSAGFEIAGVALLTVGAALALIRYGRDLIRRLDSRVAYRNLRKNLGSAILLGSNFWLLRILYERLP